MKRLKDFTGDEAFAVVNKLLPPCFTVATSEKVSALKKKGCTLLDYIRCTLAEEPTAMSVFQDSAYDYVRLVNNDTGFKVENDDVSIAVGIKKGSDLKEKINSALSGFSTEDQKKLMEQMVKIAPSEE